MAKPVTVTEIKKTVTWEFSPEEIASLLKRELKLDKVPFVAVSFAVKDEALVKVFVETTTYETEGPSGMGIDIYSVLTP